MSLEESFTVDMWAADMLHLAGLTKKLPSSEHAAAFHEFLYRKYADDPLGEEKKIRVLSAYNYLVRHREDLNQGRSAVFGESSGIVKAPIIEALYRLFLSVPLHAVEDDHPIEVMRELVRQQEEEA